MKRILLTSFLLIYTIAVFAVANTFTGTTNSNWGTSTNWSQGAVPTASDGFTTTFDNTSPNCTINVTAVCQILTLNGGTGYTNTLAFGTNTCSVSGNITLGAANLFTWTSGNGLVAHASATLTSNGCTPTIPLTFDASATYTMGDNWTVTNGLNISTGNPVINSNTINISGNFSPSTAVSGTTLFNYNGTGSWNNSGTVSNNFTVNTSGTLTISGNITYRTGTFTYTAGTVTTVGSTLSLNNTVTTNTNGITFNNITISTSNTVTLNSLLSLTGTLLLSNANPVFGGTAGFSTATLQETVGGASSITLVTGKTYTVTSTLLLNGTSTNHLLVKSSTTTDVNLNFSGSTQECLYVDGTHVNSSGGNAINVYNGTLSSTTNWNTYSTLKYPNTVSTVVSASVN